MRLHLGCALMGLVAAGPARAETVGSFTYAVPQGWQSCSVLPGFDAQFCNPGGAAIGIKAPIAGPDAAAIARGGLDGAEILQDTAILFAGQPGHLVITKLDRGGDTFVVAAAATGAGGGTKVALVAKTEVARQAVHAWSEVIDRGSFGAGKPAGPTRRFVVRNVRADCEAKVTIDGQELRIGPGHSQELQLTDGPHEFHWTDAFGIAAGVTASVPPAETLNAACVAGAAPGPGPTPPTTPPVAPPPAGDFAAVADGARAAVTFYRTCWNLVFQQDVLQPVPRSVDRMMLKVVVRRDKQRWGDFTDYPTYLAELQQAIQRTAASPEQRAELRRLAYFALLRAGQVGVPPECNPGGSALDSAALSCSADSFVKRLAGGGEAGLVTAAGMSLRFPRIGAADKPADIMGMIRKVGQ